MFLIRERSDLLWIFNIKKRIQLVKTMLIFWKKKYTIFRVDGQKVKQKYFLITSWKNTLKIYWWYWTLRTIWGCFSIILMEKQFGTWFKYQYDYVWSNDFSSKMRKKVAGIVLITHIFHILTFRFDEHSESWHLGDFC